VGFDGSSTQQAEGRTSDCILKPVAVYPDITKKNGVIVMCEVMMPDGKTPHPSNARATIPTIRAPGSVSSRNISSTRTARRSASPRGGFPRPQGEYYTGVGYKNVGCIAREIVDTHLDLCLDAGINHEGINAEVAKGQWEFQIFGKGSKNAADQMWVARYLLMRLCEKYGWTSNGIASRSARMWTGTARACTATSRRSYMREVGGKDYFEKLMAAFDKYKNEHIAVYGPDNHLRLTGLHETQSIDKFNYGMANRGASCACRTASSTTATRATSKIAVRTPRATPTRSQAASSRPLRPCRPRSHPRSNTSKYPSMEELGNGANQKFAPFFFRD
jgi:glutamine synthetase